MDKEKENIDHATKARQFILDESRTDWHNEALYNFRRKRDQAAQQVSDWEELRNLASQIKDNVLSNLDSFLVEFERAAQSNGAQVHWARDATEHNQTVLNILQRHGISRMVKSKSMLTEECHLNPFLEANGIEVVDTDLGEWIIQLRKERPSHIVAPAIHLRKEEVSETFHQKIQTEAGNSDPQYLTETARQVLRHKFMNAEAALTGVNFAVAETGSVVVCTNEGNSDMGVHRVPIQIHCMGVEKIVPMVADLGVFIRLLARSSTGQPITIYTSHHQRPKKGGEMHIVILDNGRSQHLAQPDFRSGLKCIRCGACMNTCPVYRRSGGYSYGDSIPGPIGSILTPGRDLQKYSTLPFASSLCGSCTDVCPVKIDIHEQLYKWRQEIGANDLFSKSKRSMLRHTAKVLTNPDRMDRYGAWIQSAQRWMPRFLLYNPLNIWGRNRELPDAEESFKSWLRKNKPDIIKKTEEKVESKEMTNFKRIRSQDQSTQKEDGNVIESPREQILDAISVAKGDLCEHPVIPSKVIQEEPLTAQFEKACRAVGTRVIRVEGNVSEVIFQTFPGVNLIASTFPPYSGNVALKPEADPASLASIEVAVVLGEIAVAENGAIWIPENALTHRILPFICQHLVIVIKDDCIVGNMHQAYTQIDLKKIGFGVFVAGPSKTADIEQALVVGAHGARSLTVLMLADRT